MKQIVLHALGVGNDKMQQAQIQQSEDKQELKKQSSSLHNHLTKTSTPKTVPAAQSENLTNSNISPGYSAISVQNSDHKQATKSKTIHSHNSEDVSTVRPPISKMIQHTPTPTSLASSGIGSLNEEDMFVIHSHKTVPQQYSIGGASSKTSVQKAHSNESGLAPTKQHSHSHRHRRTSSERNMLPHTEREIMKVQYSKSEHHQLKNEVQKLTLSVEEEEIRYCIWQNKIIYSSLHYHIIYHIYYYYNLLCVCIFIILC